MIQISGKVVLLGEFDMEDDMQCAKCKSTRQIPKEVLWI